MPRLFDGLDNWIVCKGYRMNRFDEYMKRQKKAQVRQFFYGLLFVLGLILYHFDKKLQLWMGSSVFIFITSILIYILTLVDGISGQVESCGRKLDQMDEEIQEKMSRTHKKINGMMEKLEECTDDD